MNSTDRSAYRQPNHAEHATRALDGAVRASRTRLRGRFLLAGRGPRAVRLTTGVIAARRTALRAAPREARRNAMSRRVCGRTDRGRLSRRRVVRGRDTGAARTD